MTSNDDRAFEAWSAAYRLGFIRDRVIVYDDELNMFVLREEPECSSATEYPEPSTTSEHS